MGEAPVESAAPAEAKAQIPAGADADDPQAMSALAGWCDDQLREIGEMYTHEEDVDDSPLVRVGAVRTWCDEQFDPFVEALESQQSMQLSEARRGALAEAWRKTAADAIRVYCMRNSFMTGSRFIHDFHFNAPAVERCREIEAANTDVYEEWIFTLGWNLARAILEQCTEADESEPEDEPVEESSEDEGEDEEGEEEDEEDEEESSEEDEQETEDARIGRMEDGASTPEEEDD